MLECGFPGCSFSPACNASRAFVGHVPSSTYVPSILLAFAGLNKSHWFIGKGSVGAHWDDEEIGDPLPPRFLCVCFEQSSWCAQERASLPRSVSPTCKLASFFPERIGICCVLSLGFTLGSWTGVIREMTRSRGVNRLPSIRGNPFERSLFFIYVDHSAVVRARACAGSTKQQQLSCCCCCCNVTKTRYVS